jgi:membrane protein required for colicin V production
MSLDLSFVDIVVILAVIVSASYAAYRGFVNETLSVVAWAAAAFATLYFAPALAPFLRERATPLVGTLVAYAGVFLVVLIPLSFVTYRFSENVRNSPVGFLDRVLGFGFGIVRGLVVIAIAYLVFSMIVPVRAHPLWMRDARLLPLIQGTSDVLLALVPNQHIHDAEDSEKTAGETPTAPKGSTQEARKSGSARHARKSYGADDRRALDRLIEATGSGNANP